MSKFPGNSATESRPFEVILFQHSQGMLKWNPKKKFKLFVQPYPKGYWVLGIRYWVLGTGYQVLVTRYWVPGRPEADLREAGGRLIGEVWGGGAPPVKKV